MSGTVYPLAGNQKPAADPAANIWLSASAGTGKTQVLSARVLRLLLTPGIEPSQILCLTFTKAGAAEMANRINAVLARWVRLEPGKLATELKHLGAEFDPDAQIRARTLFANVLDCPGGGLRIDTIHAFAQWLLSRFPDEAGLTVGARAMEDRERDLLAREVLSGMLKDAEATGDLALLQAVANFARVKDPDALRQWLMRCAAADLWDGPTAWQSPMDARVRGLLGLPADADAEWAYQALDPATFPDYQLSAILPLMQSWNAKKGSESAAFIQRWLALPTHARAEAVPQFYETILVKRGEPRKMVNPTKKDPQLPERQHEIADALALYDDRCTLLALADFLTPALEMGRTFAQVWAKAKTSAGLLDFDDLIRKAARLLSRSDAADWIRYKLDRSFDHILIDEAQDTNAAQWDIVNALIDDFFSGEGARGDRLRTIFTVGDYKQAIFGFQGTSPENFEAAKHKVRARILAAQQYIREARENREPPAWQDLDLGESYRTSAPVLDFIDRAIAALGHEAFGLENPPARHVGDPERAGLVTLWQPVTAHDDRDEPDEERDWLPSHETRLAERIAEQVRAWTIGPDRFVLEKERRRYAEPGDVMVLVRRRKELAAEIVAKLHARGVPVAGVDRLRLGAPLAVKDVVAALRFAAQPLDDLSLANLLGSPIIGWTQDDLLAHLPREKGRRLWNHLRRSDAPFVQETLAKLGELLRRADFQTPQALIAWLLIGPWEARARIVARLGRQANDPLDELVNAAFAYERTEVPSLTGFITWFDAGEGELKRDPDEAQGQVRVMTVHGAKGLQAPIVILADAASEPGKGGALTLPDDPLDLGMAMRDVPVPALSKDQRAGAVEHAAEAAERAAMQEHWRLLYVAMTRAEEALFIGGSLGPMQAKKGEPVEDSWHARLKPIFDAPPLTDSIWGARWERGTRAPALTAKIEQAADASLPQIPLWATRPIGDEPRPPRPLAPSALGEEQTPDPPLPPGEAAMAARRGVLIHRLLERLPDLAPAPREHAARRWLERQADDLEPALRMDILASALGVLKNPEFAAIFAPEALAEVPLAAEVDGSVIAGTIDRLMVDRDTVRFVDFKTSRRPPNTLADIPAATIRQMSAYAAALAVIYPGREIRGAILYTHRSELIAIPPALIAEHKPSLSAAQQSYANSA
ncbi:MAG: double-strand break repair helicase AddA [Erythrobacter sp.]|jgi:ATP-dependent helicase/nuclease subunit A|nr:double-strand break repair helicase AddA [Erythrobacter sp.]